MYHVRLIYRAEVEGDKFEGIRSLLPEGARAVIYANPRVGIVEIKIDVDGDLDSVGAALAAALLATARTYDLLGNADSVEVLSEREYIDRLGGPEEVARVAREMGIPAE